MARHLFTRAKLVVVVFMLRRTAAAAAPNQRADEGRDEGDAGCTVRLHGNG